MVRVLDFESVVPGFESHSEHFMDLFHGSLELLNPSAALVMHGSILPVAIPPPGNPGDKFSPSVPGVGNCLKPSCPGGRGRGKSKITSCSCEVRHFSVDAGPRGEDCLFPLRIARICSRLRVREE